MIADVLPLRTLPRELGFFSYTIPEELLSTITLGQCVSVPFRSQTLLGVVRKIYSGDESKLKPLHAIINTTPLLGPEYLDFLERMAHFYGSGVSTIYKRALPPLQPTKLNQLVVSPWRTPAAKSATVPNYHWYTTEAEHRTAYQTYDSERIVIIVPEVRFLQYVRSCLPPERQTDAVIWSSSDSTKVERADWLAIRNGEIKTLIATRGALWLPLHQCFDRIIIDLEHDENHKQRDQSPRFSSKDLAKMQAKYFGIQYSEMSFSPSVTSYYFIQEKRYQLFAPQTETLPAPTILYPSAGKKYVPIFAPLLEKIHIILEQNTGPQTIVLIFNQVKPGKVGLCQDCQHTCSVPLPEICPNCQSTKLKALGQTIATVATWLKNELPDYAEQIITVDKETKSTEFTPGPKIIIGTWAALPLINETAALVALLDFTRQALFPDYLTHEQLRHRLRQLQFFLPSQAELYVQSETEHPLLNTITTTETWYNEQLRDRQALGYPPYAYLIRYLIPGKTPAEALNQATACIKHLQRALTISRKKASIQGPLPLNTRWQNQDWQVFLAKTTEPDIVATVTWFNQYLGTKVKVDPNPISLTSPH